MNGPISETDSHSQESSSGMKTSADTQSVGEAGSLTPRLSDGQHPLAGFQFDKLPMELLVEIFKRARYHTAEDTFAQGANPYPVALVRVCRLWRAAVLSTPLLWTNINIIEYSTPNSKGAVDTYMERSGTCPLFLTWFSYWKPPPNPREVIQGLIIRHAERWQRITVVAYEKGIVDALLAAIGTCTFPILRDVEIVSSMQTSPSNFTVCQNAPSLRRYKLGNITSLPPLLSNLVVLDYTLLSSDTKPVNIDPLLDFLSHVTHSLEHLQFSPSLCPVLVTPRNSRISLQNLKSLTVTDSHAIMSHILTPNLVYFAAVRPYDIVDEMFKDFSAPKLQSLRFSRIPLLPLLASHHLPSMFPQLESIFAADCTGDSALVSLLGSPEPKEIPNSRKGSKSPPNHWRVENPFPKLKELAIWLSSLEDLTSLKAVMKERLEKGSKSLRKVQLPKEVSREACSFQENLGQWFRERDIDFKLVERVGWQIPAPPELQDGICDGELKYFFKLD